MPVPGNAVIRVTRDYYTQTLHVPYYVPFDDRYFPTAPIVWSSWINYYEGVREEDIVRNTDWLAANLKPYGFGYVELDDGYDRMPDGQHSWIETGTRQAFPHGPEWLASYIKSKGLRAGPLAGAQLLRRRDADPSGLVPSRQEGAICSGLFHPGARLDQPGSDGTPPQSFRDAGSTGVLSTTSSMANIPLPNMRRLSTFATTRHQSRPAGKLSRSPENDPRHCRPAGLSRGLSGRHATQWHRLFQLLLHRG